MREGAEGKGRADREGGGVRERESVLSKKCL